MPPPPEITWLESAKRSVPLAVRVVLFALTSVGGVDTVLGRLSQPAGEAWREATFWSVERNAWLWIALALLFSICIFVSCVNAIRYREREWREEDARLHTTAAAIELLRAHVVDRGSIAIRAFQEIADGSLLLEIEAMVRNPSDQVAVIDCTLASGGPVGSLPQPAPCRIKLAAHTARAPRLISIWMLPAVAKAMEHTIITGAVRLEFTDALHESKPKKECAVPGVVRI